MGLGAYLRAVCGRSGCYGASHLSDLGKRAAERRAGTLVSAGPDTVAGVAGHAKTAASGHANRPVALLEATLRTAAPGKAGAAAPRLPARGRC